MRSLICAAAASLLAAASVPAAADDTATASVLAKITAAYGGASVLGSIKTQVVTQSATISQQDTTITLTLSAPNRLLAVEAVPSLHAQLTKGFDGATAWMAEGSAAELLAGQQAIDLKCEAAEANPTFLEFGSQDGVVKREPDRTLDGKTYIVVSVTPPGCPEIVNYVDPTSFLIQRSDTEGVTVTFSEFKKGPVGEEYASRSVQTSQNGAVVENVTSVQDNTTVDPSTFSPPKGAAPAATP